MYKDILGYKGNYDKSVKKECLLINPHEKNWVKEAMWMCPVVAY